MYNWALGTSINTDMNAGLIFKEYFVFYLNLLTCLCFVMMSRPLDPAPLIPIDTVEEFLVSCWKSSESAASPALKDRRLLHRELNVKIHTKSQTSATSVKIDIPRRAMLEVIRKCSVINFKASARLFHRELNVSNTGS